MLAQVHRRIAVQPRFERQVINGFRVELLINPSINTQGFNAINISWTRSKGESVERLQSTFMRLQL